MSLERTVPHPVRAIPVRTLRAEVLEGPDAGLSQIAAADTLAIGTAVDNALVLTDTTVSRYHAEIAVRAEGILVVDHGSTNGTSIGNLRVERVIVPAGTVLRMGRTTVRVGEGASASIEIHDGDAIAGLRGRAPQMRRLMAQITRAAASDATVLVVGESGTGKERVAAALHELGKRAAAPFVTVDCGSLAPTLVASELFGHERGAFTGADRQHAGAFERAEGGTLFLDEVGELPAALQSALLGVLERRRFRRLGGKTDIHCNVRIVSATNRDLRAEVNTGAFRLDLYYRLAVITLPIPPLRERAEDVPLLVEYFLRECGFDGALESYFSDAALAALRAHHWPGNVRELRNMVEATVAMGEQPPLESQSIAADLPGSDPFAPVLDLPYRDARAALLQQFESRYLDHLLAKTKGNVSKAARDARMDRSYLIELLRRYRRTEE